MASTTNIMGRIAPSPKLTMFTWQCDRNRSSTSILDISEVKFGDGYSHRALKSINPLNQTFDVSFKNRPLNVINSIIAFFEERGGYLPFNWIDPGAVPKGCPTGTEALKVICNSWTTTVPVEGYQSLNATFTRVYN